jgi:hypothetical protein
MSDTGQDFEIPDEMSIAQAEAMQDELQGRFSWKFTENPNYIEVTGRNYYKKSGKRVKDPKTGGWKLLPMQKKAVRISI